MFVCLPFTSVNSKQDLEMSIPTVLGTEAHCLKRYTCRYAVVRKLLYSCSSFIKVLKDTAKNHEDRKDGCSNNMCNQNGVMHVIASHHFVYMWTLSP